MEENKNNSCCNNCNCKMCQAICSVHGKMCQGGRCRMFLKIIITLIIFGLIFALGIKIGEFKGRFDREYDRSYGRFFMMNQADLDNAKDGVCGCNYWKDGDLKIDSVRPF